ncbi:REP-associated tyrosine transposase [Legionella genomosp. 1]|uniref:REP-associated tyrosine transposase n=1 Tax=Legionella genomosp. 1 TaxID=1093625 RepID=UPI0021CB3440|nr:transposase [Legionella genomosp. 1]
MPWPAFFNTSGRAFLENGDLAANVEKPGCRNAPTRLRGFNYRQPWGFLEGYIFLNYITNHQPANKGIQVVQYRRDFSPGAIYFFTLTLKNRNSCALTLHSNLLTRSFRWVRHQYPFKTHAMVVLPDHLHVVWELPATDFNYSLRWRLIKTYFSKAMIKSGVILSKNDRNEYSLWQRRFWEHRIRNEDDLKTHIDYIHYNPVKHQLVKRPCDWQYSSIHQYIRKRSLPGNWGVG